MASLIKPANIFLPVVLFSLAFCGCKDPYGPEGKPTQRIIEPSPTQVRTPTTPSPIAPKREQPTSRPTATALPTNPNETIQLPAPKLGSSEDGKWPQKALFARKEDTAPIAGGGLGLKKPSQGFGLGLTMPSFGDNSGFGNPTDGSSSLKLELNPTTTEPPASQPTSPTAPSSRPTSAAASQPNVETTDDPEKNADEPEKTTKEDAPPAKFSIPTSGIIALVNSEELDATTFRVTFEQAKQLVITQQGIQLNEPMLDELRKKALESVVNQILVSQKASQAGVPYGPKEQQEAIRLFLASQPPGTTIQKVLLTYRINQAEFAKYLKFQMITNLYMQYLARDYPLAPEDVKRRYDNTIGKGSVRVRHILVSLSDTPTAEELEKGETRAKEILSKVQEPKADFVAIAKKHSDDLSGEQGGDLGFLKSGDAVKALERVIFSMDVNEIRGPVRSSLGFHILQVTHKKPPPPLAQVQDQIVREMRMKKLQARLEKEIKKLRREADIEYKVPWGPK